MMLMRSCELSIPRPRGCLCAVHGTLVHAAPWLMPKLMAKMNIPVIKSSKCMLTKPRPVSCCIDQV